MAYQLKYFLEYKSLKVGSSDTYRLELWQNTAIELTAEEIKGGRSPFSLEMPQLNHKFQVVRGRGCTINLLSDTDMKFFEGLKHIDPQEFKYIHKLNGAAIGLGYLNSDMYSEPYDQTTNYIISTTGNDGFSLMDRFRFLQSDETRYIGLKSKWEIIQICLNKVGLSYNDIRIKLATTFTDFSGDSDSTILHESYVNCANFYDEDGKGMTMREVIESILAPYGAFIVQDNGSIYITDIHTLAGGGSISFQKFNATTYAYIEDISITVEKDIYDVGYLGTGHSIDRSGGTNFQKVVYSLYPRKTIVNESIVRVNEFTTVPATFSDKDGYKYRTLVGHTIWQNIPMTLSTFEESALALLGDDRFIYYRYPTSSSDIKVFKLIDESSIFLSVTGAMLSNVISISGRRKYRYMDGVSLLITGEILAKTKDNPYTEAYTLTEQDNGANLVSQVQINYQASIGNYYYNLGQWNTTENHSNYINTYMKDQMVIANQWVGLGKNGGGELIKLGSLEAEIVLNGLFKFSIWSNTKIRKQGGELLVNDPLLQEVWIRNLAITIVNFDGSEIEDSDIEFTGQLNKLFAEEGEEITLTTGTQSRFVDNAKILRKESDEYYDILEWTRASQTYRIEELLLNSLCSNYRVNFVTLNSVKLKNEFSLMSIFTDTTFLEDNPKMMIKSSMIDYENYTHEITLVEISEDELTIVKE